jgi:hypothetical protein
MDETQQIARLIVLGTPSEEIDETDDDEVDFVRVEVLEYSDTIDEKNYVLILLDEVDDELDELDLMVAVLNDDVVDFEYRAI